jgi:hypothetical protein
MALEIKSTALRAFGGRCVFVEDCLFSLQVIMIVVLAINLILSPTPCEGLKNPQRPVDIIIVRIRDFRAKKCGVVRPSHGAELRICGSESRLLKNISLRWYRRYQ